MEAILKDTDLEEKADTQVPIWPKMMSVIHIQTSVLIIFHHPANKEIQRNNIVPTPRRPSCQEVKNENLALESPSSEILDLYSLTNPLLESTRTAEDISGTF